MPMVVRLATPPSANRMSIVKADHPLAIRPMQRQRVVDAMWLLRRHRHPRYHEADPMPASWIDHENLAIEVEQDIKARVALLSHFLWLSQ
jgi:hypothetical protein